jgi:hypothetical protein
MITCELATIIDDLRAWVSGTPVPTRARILKRWGNDFLMYRDAWHEGIDTHEPRETYIKRTSQLSRLREQAILQFGFSIPCAEVLDALAQHQPIVEIGAGSGYWTALMRHRSIDVIGTDPDAQGWWEQVGQYDPYQVNLEARQALRRWPKHTVFCSWPSLKEPWLLQALRSMHIGRRLILIEEDACADEKTWAYRDQRFSNEAYISVPAWWGCNDRCGVWRRSH